MTLVATFVVFYLHLSLILPKFNSERSAKPFSERVLERVGPEEKLKMAFVECSGLLYYTRMGYIEEIRSVDRFSQIFHSPERMMVVIPIKYLAMIRRKLNVEPVLLEEGRAGPYDLALISNK